MIMSKKEIIELMESLIDLFQLTSVEELFQLMDLAKTITLPVGEKW
jgi:hypothetical protein